MRIARDLGDVSSLLPEGITHLGDCPYVLHQSITAALRILQYEEFPIEERPPKRIWLDGKKLQEHWEQVEREREAKFKNPSRSESEIDGDPETIEENAVELITRG